MIKVEETGPTSKQLPVIHLSVCTFNRAQSLDETLASIAKQDAARDGSWAVVVVDNNCTDNTREVVERHIAAGVIPSLSLVEEPVQGLVPARQRSFHATSSPWVAFIDDDCYLEPDWVRQAIDFVGRHPKAAGFNGRNHVSYAAAAPRWVHPGMFAGVDSGGETEEVQSMLHGAGLVLRRDAVERSGWLDKPRLPDRRGESLVSGGDNELAIRTRAGSDGGDLWFVPQCQLIHHVGVGRTDFGYLLRLNYRLAESNPMMFAIQWERPQSTWRKAMLRSSVGYVIRAFRLPVPSVAPDPLLLPGSGLRGQLLCVARGAGFVAGFAKILFASKKTRTEIHGLGTAKRVADLETGSS